MLHRVLFVAGMTVGVTAPLIWGAYVSRQPSATVQRVAARERAQPAKAMVPPPARTVSPTASQAAPAPALPSVKLHAPPIRAPAPVELAMTSPMAATIETPPAGAPALAQPTGAKAAASALARAPLPKMRPRRLAARKIKRAHDGAPAVVSRYVGSHIIVVCAALSAREQRNAGCQ